MTRVLQQKAGVCSPPAKTPEALICAANYHCTSAKEFTIDFFPGAGVFLTGAGARSEKPGVCTALEHIIEMEIDLSGLQAQGNLK